MTGSQSGQRLAEWREGVEPVLARLQDFGLPDDFPFDFSPESLARLESVLLDRFPVGVEVGPNADLAESATAYVGEALLRVGGGRWEWWDGEPVVAFDDALALPPAAPLRLCADAVRERTGDVLTRAHAAVSRAVAEHRDRHPSWSPSVPRTADDIDVAALPRHERLVAWLAEREAGFPAWAAEQGGGWDFSEESLDALEAVVVRRLPTVGEFTAAMDGAFAQGAAWYLGEVARRTRGAAWQYHEDERGYAVSGDAWAGRPYVAQGGRDGAAAMPVAELRAAVRAGEPGTLRKRFQSFR